MDSRVGFKHESIATQVVTTPSELAQYSSETKNLPVGKSQRGVGIKKQHLGFGIKSDSRGKEIFWRPLHVHVSLPLWPALFCAGISSSLFLLCLMPSEHHC